MKIYESISKYKAFLLWNFYFICNNNISSHIWLVTDFFLTTACSKCISIDFHSYRFGKGGGGPPAGLEGRVGGGPVGLPGNGGGALFLGGAGGSSLLGVEGPELLLELSLELCLGGGGPVGREGGNTGGTTWLIPFSHDL